MANRFRRAPRDAAKEPSPKGPEPFGLGCVVGTAGWSIPGQSARHFPAEGTHLQRYAHILRAVEINSSFHRPHTVATYARWAGSARAGFQFSVKVPKSITHEQRLRQPRLVNPMIDRFLAETGGLGATRGPLLVQLPPSLAFDARIVGRFFSDLRSRYSGPVVCEPRHITWFSARAEALLVRHEVARVAADPALAPAAATPGAWPGIAYYRLHGSPRMYWSSYGHEYLDALADVVCRIPAAVGVWVIFDNTASGAASENAVAFHARLSHNRESRHT